MDKLTFASLLAATATLAAADDTDDLDEDDADGSGEPGDSFDDDNQEMDPDAIAETMKKIREMMNDPSIDPELRETLKKLAAENDGFGIQQSAQELQEKVVTGCAALVSKNDDTMLTNSAQFAADMRAFAATIDKALKAKDEPKEITDADLDELDNEDDDDAPAAPSVTVPSRNLSKQGKLILTCINELDSDEMEQLADGQLIQLPGRILGLADDLGDTTDIAVNQFMLETAAATARTLAKTSLDNAREQEQTNQDAGGPQPVQLPVAVQLSLLALLPAFAFFAKRWYTKHFSPTVRVETAKEIRAREKREQKNQAKKAAKDGASPPLSDADRRVKLRK